jgi:hypothetical protein
VQVSNLIDPRHPANVEPSFRVGPDLAYSVRCVETKADTGNGDECAGYEIFSEAGVLASVAICLRKREDFDSPEWQRLIVEIFKAASVDDVRCAACDKLLVGFRADRTGFTFTAAHRNPECHSRYAVSLNPEGSLSVTPSNSH